MITVHLEFVKKCDSGKKMTKPPYKALGVFYLFFYLCILSTFIYVFSPFWTVIFSWADFRTFEYDKDTIIILSTLKYRIYFHNPLFHLSPKNHSKRTF